MPSRADVEAGRAFVRLFLKNDMSRQLVRALRNAQAKLRQFGQSAMMTGRRLAIVGAAMVAPFAFATRTFAEFDDGMREVGAVTQATGAAFDMLTDKAKKLGASTSFTAIEVALLMAELGRANFDPGDIDKMTGSVLSLARATKTEASVAAGIMSTAIRQFGLDATDAAMVADVLTTGANKSFNTLESLGESLKFVGKVSKDFGLDIGDTVAVLGTLGNVGIQGSMAGTAMRRIQLALGAESKKLKGIFGVDFVDANDNAISLVDALQAVADATKNMGTAARAEKFNEAFGLRGITGASSIAGNIAGTRELRDAIAAAGGIAKKTADDMDAGLGGAFRILRSAIEGVKIAIGGALAPVLQKLSKLVTKNAQTFIKWIKANKGMVVAASAIAVGVVGLGVALMTMGAAAQFAAFGLGAVASIIAAVTSPIGILVAAIAGGAVAWVMFSESGKRAWVSLKETVMPIIDTIKDAIIAGEWGLAGKLVMAELKLAVLKGLAAIVSAFPGTFKAIAGITGMALDGLIKIFGEAITLLQGQWNAWGKHVLDTVVSVASAVVGVWQKAVEGMANWMLKTSAKGGIMGKAMSKILGVDMGEEQAKAELAEREGRKIRLSVFEDTAQVLEQRITTGKDKDTGKELSERELAVDQKLLEDTRSKIADLKAGGSGTADGRTVDVLADARSNVRRITEQWESEAKAGLARSAEAADAFMQGLPIGLMTDFEGALEGFVRSLESGQSVEDAVNDLAELRIQAAKRKAEAETATTATTAATAATPGGVPAAGGGVSAVSAAPSGVALTATYSAAAASIAGFQPVGPEKKMADGIDRVAENTAGLLDATGMLMGQLEQFIAGMRTA